ncbi:uncharacterized protein Triagg1_3654 [Trichoderma aggressivum f. europaeum]|uniref:Smr domain-containing protein n=1 Tax=Trichoderma aggressivum f. europaeum TaxID=173218 RepID=A0AAE1IJ89_9HYPO|nr:hypothetical protein Triagg1_3654 [Trichoderma aggressivum f. europaeum]
MSNIALPSQLQQLRDSFHSLLDDSLIVAIASDYDLSTSTGYDEACSTLRSLAQNVVFEEASSFDPSGAYRFTEHQDQNPIDDAAPVSRFNQGNVTSDDESIDTLSSDTRLSKSEVLERDIMQLQSLFPRIDGVDIRHVLNNADGVVAAALDSLLNLQYIQSTSDQAPSSNEWSLGANESGAKSAGKAGETGYDGSVSNSSRLNTPAAITYIAKRLHMSTEEVSIMYAESGNSKIGTVIGILDQHLLQENGEPLTSTEKKAAGDLKQKYRGVPEIYLEVIVQITGSMSTSSAELASLLNTYFSKRSMNQKLELSYRLTPLPHEDIEGLAGAAVDALAERKGARQRSPPVTRAGADLTRTLQASNALHKQKQDAMASAGTLYRRGASNPVYRQAAGYYAQRARELGRRAQEATSAAADIHVDQQSTNTTIDLHGVSVLDGVRIARQRAVDWWQTRRELRYESREGQSSERNLTIITGLGHHSAGGVSPLRQAVAAALTRDGWKFRVETGKFVLTGR